MRSRKPFLIKFFAPWCKHCQSLEKIWDKLQLEDYDSVNTLKVDCTSNEGRDLCMQFRVKAYPTIMLLRDNKFYKYKGNRSLESFRWFVAEGFSQAAMQGPIPPKVKNPEEDIIRQEELKAQTLMDRLQ